MNHSLSKQFIYELKSASLGYPGFVYFNIKPDTIPVFVYHTIDPDTFESHLIYLQENGYNTLSVDEYIAESELYHSNRKINSVLLTIDDARSSVWRYAFPLLKKYKMRATVFIIPGRTISSNFARYSLSDIWEGKCSLEEIKNLDPQDETLCTWQEIIVMYKSGLIDIESHTLFHSEVFRSLKVNSFITNSTKIVPYNFSGSPYYSESDIGKEFKAADYYGLPLFESAALMLAGPKVEIAQEFINKCRVIYENSVKTDDNWKIEIKGLIKSATSKKYFTNSTNSSADVINDLNKARAIIQSKLDTNAGNHLCLPWTIGNSETIKIVKDLGIKSCFGGTLPKNTSFNPYYISRIKNDFIFRLPGEKKKKFDRNI